MVLYKLRMSENNSIKNKTTEMNYVNVVYMDANIPLLSDHADLGYRLN
jgi:hypothetical protein